MKTYTPRFFLLLGIYLLSSPLTSQLNFQVGYGLGLVNLQETRQLLNEYNLQNPWLHSGFQEFKTLNNFIIGLRQSWDGIALGLNWKYRISNLKAQGTEPVNSTDFTKELFFNLQTYSFFLEAGGKWIQLGTSLDYNKLYIKEKHTGTTNKSLVLDQTQWGSQFYVNINFPASANCQMSLQPYYFMPWSAFSMTELKNHLQLGAEPGSGKESFRHFGISLILSNGPQSGN